MECVIVGRRHRNKQLQNGYKENRIDSKGVSCVLFSRGVFSSYNYDDQDDR